jgi:hypothetical protein
MCRSCAVRKPAAPIYGPTCDRVQPIRGIFHSDRHDSATIARAAAYAMMGGQPSNRAANVQKSNELPGPLHTVSAPVWNDASRAARCTG